MREYYIKRVEVTFEVTHYHVNTCDVRRYGQVISSSKEIITKVFKLDWILGYQWSREMMVKYEFPRSDAFTNYKVIKARVLSFEFDGKKKINHHHNHRSYDDYDELEF